MKIFNIKQMDIVIKNGATPTGCGLGNKDKVYIEFKEDDIFKRLLERWHNKEF